MYEIPILQDLEMLTALDICLKVDKKEEPKQLCPWVTSLASFCSTAEPDLA